MDGPTPSRKLACQLQLQSFNHTRQQTSIRRSSLSDGCTDDDNRKTERRTDGRTDGGTYRQTDRKTEKKNDAGHNAITRRRNVAAEFFISRRLAACALDIISSLVSRSLSVVAAATALRSRYNAADSNSREHLRQRIDVCLHARRVGCDCCQSVGYTCTRKWPRILSRQFSRASISALYCTSGSWMTSYLYYTCKCSVDCPFPGYEVKFL